MRIFLSLILFILIIGLGYYVVMVLLSNKNTVPSTVTPISSEEPIGNNSITVLDQPTDAPTMSIATNNGGSLVINNVLQAQDIKSVGDNMYTLETSDGYSLIFNNTNDSFAISLNQQPVMDIRQQATFAMADLLGVSVQELCQINAYVGVTVDFDEVYGGKNLNFAGC